MPRIEPDTIARMFDRVPVNDGLTVAARVLLGRNIYKESTDDKAQD